ncbi:unnamed protein product [Clonostachys byssicola]|uniref:Uncharacterized protein n=1 Tax=Clonostachys byssicola TaxID=160290 RepID=A0A9N9XY77_9HYPO|nr:unnamed protein product [Clonostachys byssicola]
MERPNAGPDQIGDGSQHYSLEPHTEERTTQSTNANLFDANDHEIFINAYTSMPNQQLGNGWSLPQNMYQHQPRYMAGPSNAPPTPSLPVEQPFYNQCINGPPAPDTTPYIFLPLTPNANPSPRSTPCQVAQNPQLNLNPALQHPSYVYATAIQPATSNAGYSSLGDHGSPSGFYHHVSQPNHLQAQSGFYHGVAQPGHLPAQSDFPHGVTQPTDVQAQNNVYQDAAQPSARRARKRRRPRSQERGTASRGNQYPRPNAAQVEGRVNDSKRPRTGQSQAIPICDQTSRDPTNAGVPVRFQKFEGKIKETLSKPNKPPVSREKKSRINAPEDYDDPQQIHDCESKKLAVPGGLKYSGPGEAFAKFRECKALLHKKAEKCTYPYNDETFPRNDPEWCFYAMLLYDAMANWESYQEWMKCLPKDLCNKKQQDLIKKCRERMERRVEILQARESNNASDEADDEEVNRPLLELADLLPTPEEAKHLPSLVEQHEKVLGKNSVLNQEAATGESWRLLYYAWEAQQGRTGARPGTGKDGTWESYPSFLDRLLALVNVVRTTKQVVKDLLTLGDGSAQHLANNPYAAQAGKGENLKNNVGKKFPKPKKKAEATEEAEGPGKKAKAPKSKSSTSNSQHQGEAGEIGLPIVDADDSRVDPSLENEGEPSRALLTAGDHTQLEAHPEDSAEAAVLEHLRWL